MVDWAEGYSASFIKEFLKLIGRVRIQLPTDCILDSQLQIKHPNLRYLPFYILLYTGCPIKKATQAFGSCSRTRVPILFKLTMNIARKMAKMTVTKANSLDVLPHLECVSLRRLHFCCFH